MDTHSDKENNNNNEKTATKAKQPRRRLRWLLRFSWWKKTGRDTENDQKHLSKEEGGELLEETKHISQKGEDTGKQVRVDVILQVENEEEEEGKDLQAQARERFEVKNELQEQTELLVPGDKHWPCIECFSGPQADKVLHKVEEGKQKKEEEDKGGADVAAAGSVAELIETRVGGKKKQKQGRSLRQLEEDEDLVGWLQSGNVPTEALNLLTAFVEWQTEHY